MVLNSSMTHSASNRSRNFLYLHSWIADCVVMQVFAVETAAVSSPLPSRAAPLGALTDWLAEWGVAINSQFLWCGKLFGHAKTLLRGCGTDCSHG